MDFFPIEKGKLFSNLFDYLYLSFGIKHDIFFFCGEHYRSRAGRFTGKVSE
jgi:hypothetical protein